jgi:site-specific DNA-methyltransferase (adenine-specific)
VKSELVKGDSLQELKKYDDNSVDLLCTDPPYGYGFMGRDWDKVLPDIGIFEECFRVLKPGSMAFVMSAPRSDVQYRMAEMLERVGFRIDYTPIYWTYATGFPKAMNIGKMIDKRDGNDREVISVDVGSSPDFRDVGKKSKEAIGIDKLSYGQVQNAERKVNEITKGSSELEGSYAGFQPKPAVEVVIVAMKPIDKKGYLEQAEDNQKGVTWFDDCRIPFEESDTPKGGYGAMDIGIGKPGETQDYRSKDYQKYVEKQKSFKNAKSIGKTIKGNEHFLGGDIKQLNPAENYQDTAEASPMGRFPANMLVSDEVLDDYSRYFSLDSWFQKNLESLPEPVQQTFPFMIVPKASRSEKDNGLYRNIHPTVKPLTLMSYLVTLGSRKDDMVLDPFMGSGTTPLACVSLERNYIGIDNEEEYYEIAKARVKKLEAPIKAWEKFI